MIIVIQYQYKPMKKLKASKIKSVSVENAAHKLMLTVDFVANAVPKLRRNNNDL